MEIRLARTGDEKALSKLIISSASMVIGDFNQQGWEVILNSNSAQSLLRRIKDKRYLMLVYQQAGVILGVLSILDNQKIDQLFVSPNAFKKGVARALWGHALKLIQTNDELELWVRSSSMAVPIYQSFGFVRNGQVQQRNGISFVLMKYRYTTD